jgi:hypothetical protein
MKLKIKVGNMPQLSLKDLRSHYPLESPLPFISCHLCSQQAALPQVSSLLQRLEQATSLLSETLGQARLEGYMLLPLLRVALQTLTVDAMKVYQVKALGKNGLLCDDL